MDVQEKLKEKFGSADPQARIGGKGSARRKKKVLHRSAATDDKKLQSSLKKLGVNTIPGIEEVNFIKDDGQVIHFTNPKVQASLNANTFSITGHAENKSFHEMLPQILNQLGPETFLKVSKAALEKASAGGEAGAGASAAGASAGAAAEDDEVPTLVGNFDEKAQAE